MDDRGELRERDRLLGIEADDAARARRPSVDARDGVVVEGAETGGVGGELDPLVGGTDGRGLFESVARTLAEAA